MSLKCCICGNKIGIMEPLSSLSDEYSNEKICSKCMLKKKELLSIETYSDSVKYFDVYRSSKDLSSNIFNIVDSWIEQGKEILNKSINEQNQKDEQQKLLHNYMLTSGYNFEGYKIISYNGIVSGEIVMGTAFYPNFQHQLMIFWDQHQKSLVTKWLKQRKLQL